MPTWKEFLTEFIKSWRNSFEQLSEEDKRLILASYHAPYLFTKPCQIEVIAFIKTPKVLWIVTRDKERRDMEFIVHSDVETNLESFFYERRKENPVWFTRFKEILAKVKEHEEELRTRKLVSERSSYWGFEEDSSFMYFTYDVHTDENPRSFASSQVDFIVHDTLKGAEREAIGAKAEEIKSEAEKIFDENLRSKLFKAAEEIESSLNQLKRLERHEQKIAALEGEVKGVRKLIGTTKEYQDWKVLVSDVESFKRKPYVRKDVFESEVKRLDQKIDALKEIRFWSKRTMFDIALAIIATASTIIAALLAAGIVHF